MFRRRSRLMTVINLWHRLCETTETDGWSGTESLRLAAAHLLLAAAGLLSQIRGWRRRI